MNFLLVQIFDPQIYDFNSTPFWLNLDFVSRIAPYYPEVHAPKRISFDGETTLEIPEGALDTVFITIDKHVIHLDAESSKKVMQKVSHMGE